MKKKYKIGYICGCFELLHIGHLNILERCKDNCDYLVVGICTDEYITTVKKRCPIHNERDRARMVNALSCVDKVVLSSTEETLNKKKAWDKIHFNVLFNGSDWIDSERSNLAKIELEKYGVMMKFFPYTDGISTTDIINKIKNT